MRKWRTFNCEDCGVPQRRRRDSHQPSVCAPCGVARGWANALALSERQGPAWDRWASGMARAAMAAMAQELGVPVPEPIPPRENTDVKPGMRRNNRDRRERVRNYGR